jgi:hypothetical protein
MERTKDKVIIVGFAPSYVETPWGEDAENTEIWCLNEFYKVADKIPGFRVDRWFEIHDVQSPSKSVPEHQAFLKQCPVPLYMWKKSPEYPNSEKFPLTEMIEYFEAKGYLGNRYFTNSVSLMVAYAIFLGFKELSMYGIDMATSGEYQAQRPSVEWWLGLAEGLGIKVFIPPTSDILKCTQIYGFESNNRNRAWIKAQIGELSKRTQHFAQQEEQASKAAHQAEVAQAEIRGAQQAYKEILVRTQ